MRLSDEEIQQWATEERLAELEQRCDPANHWDEGYPDPNPPLCPYCGRPTTHPPGVVKR